MGPCGVEQQALRECWARIKAARPGTDEQHHQAMDDLKRPERSPTLAVAHPGFPLISRRRAPRQSEAAVGAHGTSCGADSLKIEVPIDGPADRVRPHRWVPGPAARDARRAGARRAPTVSGE